MTLPQPEPTRKPALASPRRRLALLLGIPIAVLVVAVGVWVAMPRSSHVPAAEAGTPTTATTADVPADLLSTWEQTLRNLDVIGDCFGEKNPSPLTPGCMIEAENVGAAAHAIAGQAGKLGSRYAQVAEEARKASEDAEAWAACPQTGANTQERRDCVSSLWDLRLAPEGILAAIYAVERP